MLPSDMVKTAVLPLTSTPPPSQAAWLFRIEPPVIWNVPPLTYTPPPLCCAKQLIIVPPFMLNVPLLTITPPPLLSLLPPVMQPPVTDTELPSPYVTATVCSGGLPPDSEPSVSVSAEPL